MIFYDKNFGDIDLILRRGGHINRSDLAWYDWLSTNFEATQRFYLVFDSALQQHPDGFFYLVPRGGKLKSKLLPKSCIHLGIFIALKARDPEITRSSGWLSITQLYQEIETSVSKDMLQKIYSPNTRGESIVDTRISQEIQRAMKVLQALNFIDIKVDRLRPLESIHRFAELARYDNLPSDEQKINLEIARGIVFIDETDLISSEEHEDE